ncbi:MAG: TonB family protein [Terriglobales bacterium]
MQTGAPTGPLIWFALVAEVAKGTPSAKLVAQLAQRSLFFPFGAPLDALNEQLPRSLGATDEFLRAARAARPAQLAQPPGSQKLELAAAETEVRQLLATQPNNAALHELLAMTFIRNGAGGREDSVAELRQAVALNPNAASARFYLGAALLAPQTAAEASQNFRESLRLLPNQFESHFGLMAVAQGQGDKNAAAAESQEIFRSSPPPEIAASAHALLGDFSLDRKDYDVAAAEYRAAIQLASPDSHVRFGLGVALYDKQDYADAVFAFQDYLRSSNAPYSTDAHRWLAACYFYLRRFPESAGQAEVVLTDYPSDKGAQLWLRAASTAQANSAAATNSASNASPATAPAFRQSTTLVLVDRAVPEYPEDARTAGIEGTVSLHVLVGAGGSVQHVDVLSGPDELVDAAASAVRQWRYQPILQNGIPVAVQTTVNVVFELDYSAASPPQPSALSLLMQGMMNGMAIAHRARMAAYTPAVIKKMNAMNAAESRSAASSIGSTAAVNEPVAQSGQTTAGSIIPRPQGDANSPYVSGAPECGHAQIENGTLFMVNSCGSSVTICFTSAGTVWGELPVGPGGHGRTGFSGEAVARVGGVKVYTCPGLATPVDLNGNGVLAHYNGEYRCHR